MSIFSSPYSQNNKSTIEAVNRREQQLFRGSGSQSLESNLYHFYNNFSYNSDSAIQYPNSGVSLRNPVFYQGSNILNQIDLKGPYQQDARYGNSSKMDQLKQDPNFQQNLKKFYAVDEQPPAAQQRAQQIQQDPSFQKNMQKFYAVGDPPIQPSQRELEEQKKKQMAQYDPNFQKNLAKFYAVGDPPLPQSRKEQEEQKLQKMAQYDPNYQKNAQKFYAVNEPPLNAPRQSQQQPQRGNQNLANDPQFQQNLQKFYAANEPSLTEIQDKKLAEMKRDPAFQQNVAKFYAANEPPLGPSKQELQNQRIQQISKNDPSFQQNVQRFYAVGEPPLNSSQNQGQSYQQPYQQQQQRSNNQNLTNDPQFQQNLQKFYAANEPSLTEVQDKKLAELKRDPNFQQNMNKFYAANEPPLGPSQKEVQQQQLQRNLANDPKFQQNLQRFYAAGEPTLQEQQEKQQSIMMKDPKFQQALNKFYAVGEPALPQQAQQGQQNNSQPLGTKVLAIADSSSAVRNQLTNFFRTRGIEDFDIFTTPGGPFAFQSNQIWTQGLQEYLGYMQKSYQVKELFIFTTLDQQANMRSTQSQPNDKRPHVNALQQVKGLLEGFRVPYRISGVIIDSRGAAEKVF